MKLLNYKKFVFKKGQAVIEYILILIIGVVIVVGLLTQIAEPFKKFIEGDDSGYRGLFGGNGYYACLYEIGTLPGMSANCSYENFQQGSGDWTIGGSSNWGGGSGFSGGDSASSSHWAGSSGDSSTYPTNSFPANNYSSNTTNQTPYQPSVNEWGTGQYTGSPSFNDGRGTQRFLAQNNYSSSSLGSTQQSSNQSEFGSSDTKRNNRFNVSGYNRSLGARSSTNKGIISAGYLKEEKKDRRQKRIVISSVNKKQTSSQVEKSVLILNNSNKSQNFEEDETSFTFGKFLKYIMIGLILLIILFFIATRVMEISENLKAA